MIVGKGATGGGRIGVLADLFGLADEFGASALELAGEVGQAVGFLLVPVNEVVLYIFKLMHI